MSVFKAVAKGFILMMFGVVITRAIGFFYKVLFSRSYGADGFGLFSIGLGFFTLLATFSIMGLNIGLSRYISMYRQKDTKKLNKIILIFTTISVLVSILLAVTLIILSNQLSKIYKSDELIIIFKYFALGIPLYVAMLLSQKIFEGFKNFKYSAILEVSLSAIKFLFLLLCVLFAFNLSAVVLSFIVSLFFVSIIGLYLVNKFVKIVDVFKSKFDSKLLVDVVRYSWPLSLALILHTTLSWFDSLVLGYFNSAREVGIYNLAMSVAGLISLPSLVGSSVLLPVFSELHEKRDSKHVNLIYSTAIKWLSILCLPILFMIITYPSLVLNIVGGAEFLAGDKPLVFLAFAFLISTVILPSTIVLLAAGKTKFLLMNTIVAVITNLILNLLLIPKYGMIGAAISFFTTTFLVNVLRLIEVNKLFRIQPFNWKYMKLLLNFLIAGLVSFYLVDYLSIGQYSTLILSFITFTLIYFSLFFALKCYSKEDLEVLNAIKMKLSGYKDKYF